MRATNARTVGIVWYQRENYAEVRGVMEDAHVLPRYYESWLRSAQSIIQLEHARGSDIVKAPVDPDAFVAWCRATGQRADVQARTRHANLAVEDYCNALTTSDEVQAALDVAREIPEHLRARLS